MESASSAPAAVEKAEDAARQRAQSVQTTGPEEIDLYLLVIAHPDDESMFFVPWLRHMRQRKERQREIRTFENDGSNSSRSIQVWLVCLTTGNYDGLGSIRSVELQTVTTTVFDDVVDYLIVIDEPTIVPDHPTRAWDVSAASVLLQERLAEALRETRIATANLHVHLVTFDEFGVSGHVNHRDTYLAVHNLYQKAQQQQQRRRQQQQQQQPQPQAQQPNGLSNKDSLFQCQSIGMWTLESVRGNPFVKYFPVGEWIRFLVYWLCRLFSWQSNDDVDQHERRTSFRKTETFRMHEPWINWKAMATHRSQFVWYRRLFVVFSCYTYWNRLRKVVIAIDDHNGAAPSLAHKDD